MEPVLFVFVLKDEGGGAHAVTGGVAGGDGSAFRGDGAGMAAAASFGVGDLVFRKHNF